MAKKTPQNHPQNKPVPCWFNSAFEWFWSYTSEVVALYSIYFIVQGSFCSKFCFFCFILMLSNSRTAVGSDYCLGYLCYQSVSSHNSSNPFWWVMPSFHSSVRLWLVSHNSSMPLGYPGNQSPLQISWVYERIWYRCGF